MSEKIIRVIFQEGRYGGPVVIEYGRKIGVVERGSTLHPKVGEEWEVMEVRDTAPGERRGVRILRPIRRVEKWVVVVKEGLTTREEGPLARKISGRVVLEERPLEKGERRTLIRGKCPSAGGEIDVIYHVFKVVIPPSIKIEGEIPEWEEIEIPQLEGEIAITCVKALLHSWRQGKPVVEVSFPYRHKYGEEIEIKWRGHEGIRPFTNLAILKDGKVQWAEVRGVFFGWRDETIFSGGPVMVGRECGANTADRWLKWVEGIYNKAMEKVKNMPPTALISLASLDDYEACEDGQSEEEIGERTRKNLLNALEAAKRLIKEELRKIADFGEDVVLRRLPMEENILRILPEVLPEVKEIKK
jgi:hypothetical protein